MPTSLAPARTSKQSWWAIQQSLSPYLFVAPFVLLFSIFTLYPLARSIVLSMHQTVGSLDEKYVGMANYQFLLRDLTFWLAVANTVGYAIVLLMIQIPLALGLALLLNSKRVKAKPFFRMAFFSTHLVGSVFVAVLFAQLLSPRRGLLNRFISLIVGYNVEINWLSRPELAMPSVLMAALWLSVGYSMVYFLAALQSVDHELYEAAEIDGAGNFSKFWHVTLPGIRPVLLFLVLVGMIGALQLFELPYVLFEQTSGPVGAALTMVMYLFIYGIGQGDLGYAAAVGWALVAIIMGLAIVQLRVSKLGREA